MTKHCQGRVINVTDNDADLAVAKRTISYTVNFLLVQVQANVAIIGHDSEQVGLP